jgi:hypothetical protein
MALIRGHHSFDDHFTQIPNDWVRDDRLSLEARGLLAQIMSHRPGWNLSIKSLAARNKIGRDKVKRILDELLDHGYLERSEKQAHDENGHLAGFDYTTKDPEGVTQEPYKAEPYKAEPDEAPRPPKKNILLEEQVIKKTISKKAMTADDYNPSQQYLDTLASKYEGLNIQEELEKFRDYHAAKGSKFDIWDRAFQRWVRQAWDWSPAAKEVRARKAVEEELERYKRENGVE